MTMYVRTVVPMTITVSSQDYEDDVVIDSRSPYKVLPLWAAQRVEFQELWDEEKVEVATDTAFTNIITSIPVSELGDAVASVAGLSGEISASGLRTALSINNVDNTSDATKNSAVATLTNKTLTAAIVDAPSGQDPLLVRVGGNTAFTFNQYGELLSLAGYGIFYDGNVSNTAFSSTGPLFLTSGKSTGDSHDVTVKPSGAGKIKLLSSNVEVNDNKVETRSTETLTTTKTFGGVSNHRYIVLISADGAPTLPTAVGNTSMYTLKNIHSSTRTVLTTSSQTIEGATSYVLPANASISVVSDNSNWRII